MFLVPKRLYISIMMHLVIAMTMVFQQATKGKRHTSLIERGDCIRMESIKGAFVKYD